MDSYPLVSVFVFASVFLFVFASVFLFVFVFMLSCGQGSEWTVEEMAPFPALYILYSPPFTGCLLEPGKNTQSTIHAIYDCIPYIEDYI